MKAMTLPGHGCLSEGMCREGSVGMSWIKAPALEARVGALETMNGAGRITAAGLYARYLEEVFRYVLRRIPSVEEAEDITAEVFADAFVGCHAA